MNAPYSICVYCLERHTTRFQLCPACERLAVALKKRAGLPVLHDPDLQAVKEEPDD